MGRKGKKKPSGQEGGEGSKEPPKPQPSHPAGPPPAQAGAQQSAGAGGDGASRGGKRKQAPRQGGGDGPGAAGPSTSDFPPIGSSSRGVSESERSGGAPRDGGRGQQGRRGRGGSPVSPTEGAVGFGRGRGGGRGHVSAPFGQKSSHEPAQGQPQYSAPQPGQPQYGAPQPGQPQYGAPQPGQPQYGAPQPGQPQYGAWRPGQPQYGAPQPGQPRYGAPQPGQPQYGAPKPGQPQYGAPQPGQPQYGAPRPGQPQYGAPQPGQPQYGAARSGQPQYGAPQPGQPQYAAPQPAQEQRGDRRPQQEARPAAQPGHWQKKPQDRPAGPAPGPSQPAQQRQAGTPERAPSTTLPHALSKISISGSSTASEEPPAVPMIVKAPGTEYKKKIIVQSNHFALNFDRMRVKEAFHYDVSIEEFKEDKGDEKKPPTTQKNGVSRNRRVKDKVQFSVMRKFLQKYFPNRYPSFDGRKNLYAATPLTQDLYTPLVDTSIVVTDDLGKEKNFKIEIQFVRRLSLLPEKNGSNTTAVLPKDAIQCLDIVLRNAPMLTYSQVGRSFFKQPEQIINLGGGMEMYYGFYQSVVIGGRPLLNVHLVHKAFPKNLNVIDVFLDILESNDKRRDKPRYTPQNLVNMNRFQIEELNSYMKGLKVSYAVPGFPKVIYRVNGLARSAKEEKIENVETVFDYFRTKKRYNIKFPDIPLIWVGSRDRNIKIPAELCTIEKDQAVQRKMTADQTTAMIGVAATDTKRHRGNTINRLRDANYNGSPYVQEFGLTVNNEFETTEARILPPPNIKYRDGVQRVDKGTWFNKSFHVSKTVSNWAIVSLDNYVRVPNLDAFKNELLSASRSCGLVFENAKPDYPQFNSRGRSGPTKKELEMFFKDQSQKNYDVIFVVLPTFNSEAVYSNVKNAAEIAAGCLTQCVLSKTLNRMNRTTATNILLKVNSKLDGINHVFEQKPEILTRPVMILGADVTHPGPTAGDIPSIAAIIASHDPTGFQYNMTVRLQPPRMEYIVDLKNVVVQKLKYFFARNKGVKPEKIIYFRDGVSEGQFPEVLYRELTAIQAACREVQRDGYNPQIAFLVVQKRHHTRLFPLNDRDSEDPDTERRRGNYNVPAGTCVDTNIVDPNIHNFYLVSHASIKGVARPTKYCTLHDDINLTNNEIQQLTYYLCHMFARCNRSVSYPAPTYYAHLGALRGKAYIRPALDEHNFNMEDLEAEMSKIQTKPSIIQQNPMFFI